MVILVTLILVIVLLSLIGVIFGFFFFAIDTFLELPFVPAKRDKIRTIISLAQIKPGDVVVDLGSGDGRLLFAAAARGARAIGYELNPYLVLFTKLKAKLLHMSFWPSNKDRYGRNHALAMTSTIEVHRKDLWRANLKQADVIFVYGRAKTMQRFEDFVYQNAKKGTCVVVNTNAFPTKKPTKTENKVYLYRVLTSSQ